MSVLITLRFIQALGDLSLNATLPRSKKTTPLFATEYPKEYDPVKHPRLLMRPHPPDISDGI